MNIEDEKIIVAGTIKQYFPEINIKGVVSLETLDVFYKNLLKKYGDRLQFYFDEKLPILRFIRCDSTHDHSKIECLKSIYRDFDFYRYSKICKHEDFDVALRLCSLSREFSRLEEVKKQEGGELTKKCILEKHASLYSEIIKSFRKV